MDGAVIRCRLDLMLRLVDTTTGTVINEGDVRFYWNDVFFKPIAKGEGVHVFLNHGRDNGLMHIEVKGYDPKDVTIDYEKLDERLPGIDVFLIPSENTRRGGEVLTFSGHLAKLESIEAIDISKPVCSINEYNAKKNIMSLFLPGKRLIMDDVHYGLVNQAEQTFEHITVTEAVSEVTISLAEPLKEPYQVNAPICRVIFGDVDKKGNFVFRVRDRGGNQTYLFRIVVNGEERFISVDMEHLDGVKLSAAKKRPVKPSEEEEKKAEEKPAPKT